MNLYSYAKAPVKPGRRMHKIIMVMKLIFFIITIACVQVSAVGYSQNVTIQQKDATLTTVFSSIEKQTGYSFFWKNEDLTKLKVDVKLQNAPLEEALKEVFKGLPLTYSIVKKSIVVQAKAPSFIDRVAAAFAGMDIIGVVIDADNIPLSGATITVKGGKQSTTSGARGQFFLKGIAEDAILQISFIGYITKEVKANSNLLGIKLELSTSKLDEVQVMAYGTTNRRLGTGNISNVTAEEIEKQPVMNPLLALQGRVPGMVVTPNSGYASGSVKVEIRGRSTINSKFTSDPLYIIDGVPLTYLEIGGASSYEGGSTGVIQTGFPSSGGGQSPLYNINPADIASIEVLKDADATAIYGSRGANGVILISTKKGKIGATKITAEVSQGISKVSSYWDMLNTQQYLKMRREAFKNDGIVPTALNAPDLMVWDTTRYTNWQKELWGSTGQLTTASSAISGGNEHTQFRISGNYTRQTEILTASGANKRASLGVNISNFSPNRKFKTIFTANYSYSDVNNVNTAAAVTLPPNAPPIYNSEGGLNYQEWNDAGLPYSNPFSSLKSIPTSKTHLVTANLNLAYELFKGFEMSSSFGYNNSHNSGGGIVTIASQNPIFNPTGNAGFTTNNNQNWIIEPQFNYKADLGKGRFTALLGATLQAAVADAKYVAGFGYTDDNLLGSLSLAPFTQVVTDKFGEYKYAAIFSRFNYNWDNKYVLNISGRRDGSSRFGKGKQYGNFGSVGLAWIASQEKWIKNILPAFVSFVKLRGSYGITGSDAVGEYQYLTQWSGSVNGVPVLSYGGIKPLVSLHAVNPDYQWQENKKLEGGLSMSFLNDRINFETALYRERCNNQLTDYPTPVFSGFPSVTANWPANIQNSGWEFSLSAKLMSTKNFSWSVNVNGSINKNKLLAYPDIEHSPYYDKYFVGKPLNANYVMHYIGINPLNGQYSYEDYNHDGAYLTGDRPGEGNDDRYITINLDPKFNGGLGNEFQFKNWNLNLFFQYKNQTGINSTYSVGTVGFMNNVPLKIYNDHWSQPGQQAKYARFTTVASPSDSYVNGSDLRYTDASYLRLSNVSLSYTLPEKLMKNKTLHIFMHAQNVWTWTRYEGLDPDTQNFGSMPTAKVFTAGLSLTL